MKTLTKENFFNRMQEQYPIAMKTFCDWIDQYKKDNDWDTLFKITGKEHEGYPAIMYVSRKYHDLPYAMQMGIWFEFVRSQGADYEISVAEYDLQDDIEKYLRVYTEDFGY